MKLVLQLFFAGVFLFMTIATIRTSLAVSLWDAWADYAANPWAIATLYDAYSGFLIFFVWVVYKEPKLWVKALWFMLIMGLGNIATSLYVLIQLFRLKPGKPVVSILLRGDEHAARA